jgi:hypothetical protein
MSALQRAIAELHRWKIPEGFTFVRSHRRGDVEKAVVYRSRSALRALYEIEDVADHAVRDDWFGFETRVRGLLRDRALVPEQIELLGDEGISIFATSSPATPRECGSSMPFAAPSRSEQGRSNCGASVACTGRHPRSPRYEWRCYRLGARGGAVSCDCIGRADRVTGSVPATDKLLASRPPEVLVGRVFEVFDSRNQVEVSRRDHLTLSFIQQRQVRHHRFECPAHDKRHRKILYPPEL